MPRADFPPRPPDAPVPGKAADAWKVKFADAMLAAGLNAKRRCARTPPTSPSGRCRKRAMSGHPNVNAIAVT